MERATHGEALERITKELGDEWKKHAIENEGGYIADRREACNHIINFSAPFYSEYEDNDGLVFPGNEEQIHTRLGDDRLTLKLEPPPNSPFDPGRTIEMLEVPLRWLGGVVAPEAVTPEPALEGFKFNVEGRSFVYDRLGLRRG